MGRGGGQNYRQSSRAHSFGRFNKKKAGQYGESGKIWDEWEKSQNLKKKNPSSMVHNSGEPAKMRCVPRTEEIEVITVGHPDAELLKVFLLREEKQALKDAASKQGQPMYHLVRQLILDWLEDEKKQAS